MAKTVQKHSSRVFTATPENDFQAQGEQSEAVLVPGGQPQAARAYKGSQQVDHDLFKLESAKMKKNVSYTDEPMIEEFAHCHIFHTVDSNGKKQDTSSAVGGHHHEIVVSRGATGVPSIVVGPPLKWVMKKKFGKKVKTAVPIAYGADVDADDAGIVDTHTHETTYLGSEKITLRSPSIEFAKFDAAQAMGRVSSVEGVTSR